MDPTEAQEIATLRRRVTELEAELRACRGGERATFPFYAGPLATVLNRLEELVFVVGRDLRFRYANRRLLAVWGLSEEQARDKSFRELGYPEDLIAILEGQIRQVIETREPVHGETEFTGADGTRGVYEYTFLPLFGADGAVEAVGGHAQEESKGRVSRFAAAANEAKYRSLFNSIDQGFCIAEVLFDGDDRPFDYRFLEVNRVFEEQTGLVNATGRTARELVPGLERSWFEIYGSVASTGQPTRFTNDSPALGRTFDVYAFRVGEPEARQVAILFRDITGRRRMEQERRESEERFRNLADHAPVMIWVRGPDGQCTYLNRRWYEFTGQTEAEALGLGWLEATHPEDRPAAERRFLEANARQEPFRLEYRLRRDDGEYCWAIDAASPRFGMQGEFLGYVGSVIDISERREMEEMLRSSEARFRELAEAVPAIVWTADPGGSCTYLNGNWYAYTGLPRDGSLGGGWVNAVATEDRLEYLGVWNTAREQGQHYEMEARVRRVDGTYCWMMSRANPVRDGDGRITQWVGVTTDIHVAKTSEAALRRANRELEEFAYVASHDLQEPLRMVNIYVQQLLRRSLSEDPEAQQYARVIGDNVRRMQDLIRDILAFSRSAPAEESLGDEMADLGAALQEAMTTLRERLREEGATVYVRSPMPRVRGAQNQFSHVFQNLIDNSLKYRKPEVAPVIEIRASRRNGSWVVQLEDNGIGFEQRFAERIFGLFKRLHKQQDYPGTGLGLAICQRIVERYGGEIRAEGRPGAGATFEFSVPAPEES